MSDEEALRPSEGSPSEDHDEPPPMEPQLESGKTEGQEGEAEESPESGAEPKDSKPPPKSKRKKSRKDPFADDPFAAAGELEVEPAELEKDPFAGVERKPKKSSSSKSSSSKSGRKRKPKDPFASDPFAAAGELEVQPAELEKDPFAGITKGSKLSKPKSKSSSKSSSSSSSKSSSSESSSSKSSSSKSKSRRKRKDPFAEDPFAKAGAVEASPAELEEDPFVGVVVKAPEGLEQIAPREDDLSEPRKGDPTLRVITEEEESGAAPSAAGKGSPQVASEGETALASTAKSSMDELPAAAADDPEPKGPKEAAAPESVASATSAEPAPAKPLEAEAAEEAEPEPRDAEAPSETNAKTNAKSVNEPAAEKPGAEKPKRDQRQKPAAAKSDSKDAKRSENQADPKDEKRSKDQDEKPTPARTSKDEKRSKDKDKDEKPTPAKTGKDERRPEDKDKQRSKDKDRQRSKDKDRQRSKDKKRKPAFKLDLPEPPEGLAPDEDSSAEAPPALVRAPRRWPAVMALVVGVLLIGGVAAYGYQYLERQDQEATLAALEAEAEDQPLERLEFSVTRLPSDLQSHPRVLAVLEGARERAAAKVALAQAGRILARMDPRAEPSKRLAEVSQALEIAPTHVEALLLAARLSEITALAQAKSGPARAALADARGLVYRAEAAAPESAEVALVRGLIALRSGDANAKSSLKDAERRGPHTLAGRTARGELALLAGDATAAEAAFDSALSLADADPRALRGRGEARRRLGLLDEAKLDAVAAAAADPWSIEAQLLLARIALGPGGGWEPLSKAARLEFDSALAAARRLFPAEPTALALGALLGIRLNTLGDVVATENDRARAYGDATSAVSSDPQQAAGWAVLATLARSQGKRSEAQRCLEAGLPFAQADPRAERLLLIVSVRLAVAQSNSKPALAELNRIVELAPREPFGLLLRARALHVREDLRGAVRDLSRVLQAAPKRHDLFVLRAEWLLQLDPPQIAGAIEDLDTYLKKSPDDGSILLQRAELCLSAELPREALADLERAETQGAKARPALAGRIRAAAYFRAERWSEAAEAYQALLNLDPRPKDASALEARLEVCRRYGGGGVLLR